MDVVQRSASSINKDTHHEARKYGDGYDQPNLGNEAKSENESCSCSSSDTSSEEDFFHLDASELSNSKAAPHQRGENNAHLASELTIQKGETTGQNSVTKHGTGSICAEGRIPVGSPELGPVSTIGMPFSSDLGVKQSPPIQVMVRSDVPDPNRIPSSIFARNNTNAPMEWSVASNESLFSIHMGNSSFSRDHAFLLGKSQELTNFSSSQLDAQPVSTLASSSPGNLSKGQGLAQPGAAEAANAEAMKDVLRAAAEGHADKDRPSTGCAPRSTSTSRLSDGSVRSFAFPILTGDGRNGSIKVDCENQPTQIGKPHKHPSHAESPKVAQTAAGGSRWFSCLSCCTFCSRDSSR